MQFQLGTPINIDDFKDIVFGLKGRVLNDKLYELAIAERAGECF